MPSQSLDCLGNLPGKVFIGKVAAWKNMDNVGWLIVLVRHIDDPSSRFQLKIGDEIGSEDLGLVLDLLVLAAIGEG